MTNEEYEKRSKWRQRRLIILAVAVAVGFILGTAIYCIGYLLYVPVCRLVLYILSHFQ